MSRTALDMRMVWFPGHRARHDGVRARTKKPKVRQPRHYSGPALPPVGLLARAPAHLLGRVTRRFALLLALAAAPGRCPRPGPPPAEAPADLSGGRAASRPTTTRATWSGNARRPAPGADFLLTADEIRFNQRTQIAVASGPRGPRPAGRPPARRRDQHQPRQREVHREQHSHRQVPLSSSRARPPRATATRSPSTTPR